MGVVMGVAYLGLLYVAEQQSFIKTAVCCTFTSKVIGKRAKRVRHYQWCTNSRLCGICVYVYIYTCIS